MSNIENSKPVPTEGFDMPDELSAEIAETSFEEIITRLWNLGVVPVLNSDRPDVFSRPLGLDKHLTMLGCAMQVEGDNHQVATAQRLVFNTRSEDSETGLPNVVVDDYVLDYTDSTLSHLKSLIKAVPSSAGVKYAVGHDSAPLVIVGDMEASVTYGKAYQDAYFEAAPMKTSDLEAQEQLLRTLELISEAHRDAIADFRQYPR